MAEGDTARLYHRLTSYESEGWDWDVKADDPLVLQDFVPNDFATWPAPCKTYPDGLPVVGLPREWGDSEGLDLAALARILYLSAGVVRVVEREDRPTLLLRAAGSAGGRFPYELYVAARDGVHWYDPVGHALVQVGPPAAGEATTLIVTGVPWRTGWRYSERGLRHIYWDAGTVLAQTLALADGLAPRLWTTFPDEQVTRLVGADGTHEFPLALVTLGDGLPAVEPSGEAAAGAIDTRAPLEFPLVTLAQHAGDVDTLGAPWPAAAPTPPAERPRRRDPAPRLDPPHGSGRDDRRARVRLRRSPRAARHPTPHFIAVHGVDDIEPGLYRWPDIDTPLRARPAARRALQGLLDQDLGRDAAFVVMAAADLDQLDDRGYRDAQLGAGLVNGRLHLAAYASASARPG